MMNGDTIKLSDYIIERIVKENVKHIFMVSGGGAMHIIDSLGRNDEIQHISNHHEQASAIAAEGYQRITNNLGVCLITTGPAGTNTLTGVLCAWNDSIPILYISGQAKSTSLIGDTGLRQRGVHEANITEIVKSVTKYAVTVKNKLNIKYHLDKAIYLARNGRPGPVWIDVPLDIQASTINIKDLVEFNPDKEMSSRSHVTDEELKIIKNLLLKSSRPIIISGHGIRLSKSIPEFMKFIENYNIPVVTTKNGMDIVYDSHKLLAGRIGNYGQRAGNFAVQNSDLVLALGTRLSNPTVGYQTEFFAREAKKIVVDIDEKQLKYSTIKIDVPIHSNVKEFIIKLNKYLDGIDLDYISWVKTCHAWRKNYPIVVPEWKEKGEFVNPYYFFEILSEEMDNNDILVTDQGATFYCSTVAFKLKKGQRLFTNGGFSPMGYGLPAAIGACFGNDKKRIFCAHGDGGLQLNIQELQTIVHHNLPIKLYVFDNNGYTSIRHTQIAYFNGFFVGCEPESGLSMPNILKVAEAYGISSLVVSNNSEIRDIIKESMNYKGPQIIKVNLDPMQPISPRVTSVKREDGTMVSKPLEDMYPFLDREEFEKQMIINPVNEE